MKSIDRLKERREQLRMKLRDHFTIPVSQRDYKKFEEIVNGLDKIREQIRKIRERRLKDGQDTR